MATEKGGIAAFNESQQAKKEKAVQEEPKAPTKVESVEPAPPVRSEEEVALDERLKAALKILQPFQESLRGELKKRATDVGGRYQKVRKDPKNKWVPLIEELERLAKEIAAEAKAKDRVNPRLEGLKARIEALAVQAGKGKVGALEKEYKALVEVEFREAEKLVGGLEDQVFKLETETAETAVQTQESAVKQAEEEVTRQKIALSGLKGNSQPVNAASLEWARTTLAEMPKKPDARQQAAKANAEAILAKKGEFERLTGLKNTAEKQLSTAQNGLAQSKEQAAKVKADEKMRVEKVKNDEEEALKRQYPEATEYLALAKETAKLLDDVDDLAGNDDAEDAELTKRYRAIDGGVRQDRDYAEALKKLKALKTDVEAEKTRLKKLAAERTEFATAYLPLRSRLDKLEMPDSGADEDDLKPVHEAHDEVLRNSDQQEYVEAKKSLGRLGERLTTAEKRAAEWRVKEGRTRPEPRERVADWDWAVRWIVDGVIAAFKRRFDFAGPSVYLSSYCPKDLYPPDELQRRVRAAFRGMKPRAALSRGDLSNDYDFVVESGPGKRDNYNVKVKMYQQKARAQIHVVYE